jgi:hypothetical protein
VYIAAEDPASGAPAPGPPRDGLLSSIAEGLLHVAARAWQPQGGLAAAAAEAAAAGLLRAPPTRVQRELAALPYDVLASMARRTPASIVCGAARQLAAAAAAATSAGGAAPQPDVLTGMEGRAIDGAWTLLSPGGRLSLLHLCRQVATSAAVGAAAAAAAGGGDARQAPAPAALGAVLGGGPAVAAACASLLAALEVQQLGQQVTTAQPQPPSSPAQGGGKAALLARQVARAAVAARLALAVHDCITGGSRQSWKVARPRRGQGSRTAEATAAPASPPPVAANLGGGGGSTAIFVQGSGGGGGGGGSGAAAAPPAQPARRRSRGQGRPPVAPPLALPRASGSGATRGPVGAAAGGNGAGSPAAVQAAGGAGSGDDGAAAAALWRRLPLRRRAAYHLHIALRTVWLALMGDPSFWQDAADLIGPRPAGGAAWAGYAACRTALRLLALVAVLSQVGRRRGLAGCCCGLGLIALPLLHAHCTIAKPPLRPPIQPRSLPHTLQTVTLLFHRWTLWRWPGIHTLMMGVARGGALEGVAVYAPAPAGRLHRVLAFSRQHGITARFFRGAEPLVQPRGRGAKAEAEALLAAMEAAAAADTEAAAAEAAAAAAAAAAEAAGQEASAAQGAPTEQAGQAKAGRRLDQAAVAGAAAQLAALSLGISKGDVGEWGLVPSGGPGTEFSWLPRDKPSVVPSPAVAAPPPICRPFTARALLFFPPFLPHSAGG